MMSFDLSPAVQRVNAMVRDLIANLPSLILGCLVMVLFFFAARFTRNTVTNLSRRRLTSHKSGNAGLAIGRLAQGAVLLFGLLVSLSVALPTFKPTDVIQLLGIGSVAIGFAFRDIFQNFLAGLLILVTQPFRIDDQIVVSDFEGTVEDIQTRATLIRTFDGRRVVIPNSDLFTQKVTVNTAFEQRRIKYQLGIGYDDDVELAKRVILEAIAQCDKALKEPPPEVLMGDFAPYSINLSVRWWISPPTQRHYVEALDQVLVNLKTKLEAAGISVPFPTTTIAFAGNEPAPLGQVAKR